MTPHSPYPLLEPFFREGRGTVYYKAYPPYRGDDVQSIIDLARILPAGVTFVPIPPRIPHVGDLRHLLKALLDSVSRPRGPVGAASGDAASAGDAERGGSDASSESMGDFPDETSDDESWKKHREIEESVLELIKECLPPERREKASELIGAIRGERVYTVLREIVASTLYGGVDDLSFVPIVPDEGPLLVIGRPELFQHDAPLEALKSPHALPSILKDAGYPNRFDFLSESGDVRFNTHGIHDRKTNICHLRGNRFQDDVGFVFLNRLPDGRTVMVAAGTTALGTYSAVKMLTESRPVFAEAMARHQSARGPAAVDIAFRCWHHRATQAMLFPFAQPSQHLTIVPLNADLVGFRWSRRSHDLFRPLLDWWSPHERLDGRPDGAKATLGGIEWSWDQRPPTPKDRAQRTVVNVSVSAPAFQAGGHVIVCGDRMAKMLSSLRERLTDDLKDWLNVVRNPGSEPHGTFRPLLLVGETGTGKTVLAECIAEVWPGTTLEHDRHHLTIGPQSPPNALLDAVQSALRERLERWPEFGIAEAPRILTFSPSEYPSTMLEREFFGQSARYATESGPACGVFLQAGTGVLFLDELLELPAEQLSRLLVALQKGRVRPLGAERDYKFHCRLVAATNQAASIEDLERRTALGELNPSIVARFKQRYEIVPLRERPEEIVPHLIQFIKKRIEQVGIVGGGSGRRDDIYVRISRPALVTLLGHDFPENVRELERFAHSLPRDLLTSFCTRWEPTGDCRPADGTFIRLEHLNVLKPTSPGAEEPRDPNLTREIEETEFFQFTLSLNLRDLSPARRRWFDDPPITDDREEASPTEGAAEAARAIPAGHATEAARSSDGTDPRTLPDIREEGELRVDGSHAPVRSPARTPSLQKVAAGAARSSMADRAAYAQALDALRHDKQTQWIDELFGTSRSDPDGDFELFERVRADFAVRFREFDDLRSIFDDPEFSTLLKQACDRILSRLEALGPRFTIRMLKPLQKDVQWTMLRRRLPLAPLVIPMHRRPNDSDYQKERLKTRHPLRKSRLLNEVFVQWNDKHYGSGNASDLLSILLGEDASNLH